MAAEGREVKSPTGEAAPSAAVAEGVSPTAAKRKRKHTCKRCFPRAAEIARNPEGAEGNDRDRGILDRRADQRRASLGAGRVGLLPRRRGRLHAAGARGAHQHHRRRHAAGALGERALCGEAGEAGARAARRDVGACRDRRDGADRQPLRRSGGAFLHRHFRPGRRGDHAGTGSSDRQANMRAFAARAFELLAETLAKAGLRPYSAGCGLGRTSTVSRPGPGSSGTSSDSISDVVAMPAPSQKMIE